MKKISLLLSVLLVLFIIVGCGSSEESTPTNASETKVEDNVEEVVEEGYATDEQKKELVAMLVEMFNGVNTDFNLMVELLEEKELVVEGTELAEDLYNFQVNIHHVRDGLTGATMTSADAEEFMGIIEATDIFIVETIEEYLQN